MLKEKGISVRQALSMEMLKDARVLAGESGLDRIITGISIMEVPDIVDWVKDGELLLTTAYSIKDDKSALMDLVPALNKKGLSGIAIKTKRYISIIPEEIITMGNELGFPIIELPYKVSFSDVTSTVLVEVFNRQAGILIKMENIHQKLMNVVLAGGSLKEIGNELEEIIENPIMIKDYIFGKSFIINHINEAAPGENHIRGIISGKNYFEDELANSKNTYKKADERIGDQTCRRWIFPIIADQRIFGEINVFEVARKVNAVDVRAIEYTCAVIALELMKQITVFEIESRHKYEFLEELLSPEPGIHAVAVKQAEMYGLEAGSDYMIAILSMKEMGKYFSDAAIEKGTKYKNKLLQTIEEVVKKSGNKAFMGYKGDAVTALIAFNKAVDQAKTVKDRGISIINNISQSIEANYGNITFFAGIGRCYNRLGELWRSNDEAKRALSFSKLFRNEKIVHYDDLGIFRLLCMEHQEDEIRKFCHETIMPLINYDKAKNGELVKTLQTYFECEGNLKKVCKTMFIHYNTILYRIQKIQRITGLDLGNANNRLNLEVSLKIMSLINYDDNAQNGL